VRVAVGSDHAAVELRDLVCGHLRGRGCEVQVFGPAAGETADYPDQAAAVAQLVRDGAADLGVLLCGTGIGMSIAANKIAGIRAALVHDAATAQLAAQHNHANVLCLGARVLAPAVALACLDAWLDTPFEHRHQRRLDKISALEAAALQGPGATAAVALG